ncbi:MAG: hypothetical protein JWO38_1008 [Gemmataceae bacterium]|nr:hypothetical protein [Gemmataceae bacterium]
MSEDRRAQRRAFYRLRYPEAERPTVQVDDRGYEVAELSEAGVRVLLAGQWVGPGAPFRGFLRFRDGVVVLVSGEWLRTEGDEGVARLTTGVSLRRMLDEQRRLLRLYPDLFEDEGHADDAGPG